MVIINVHVRIYENSVKEIATFSKGDNIKIESNVSLFSPPPSYLPLLTLP